MKKLLCLLLGCRLEYRENFIANDMDWVCTRCGNRIVQHYNDVNLDWEYWHEPLRMKLYRKIRTMFM